MLAITQQGGSKMNPYKMFKTDAKAEADVGVTLDYGDFRICIARAGGNNKRFTKILQAKMKPYRRQLSTGNMDEEVAKRIMRESYAEAIVLGFDVKVGEKKYEDGVPREDGSIAPYNKEEVIRIFTELPDLFLDVQAQADSIALFREEEIEEDAKNS
jgi:hypothetical protein